MKVPYFCSGTSYCGEESSVALWCSRIVVKREVYVIEIQAASRIVVKHQSPLLNPSLVELKPQRARQLKPSEGALSVFVVLQPVVVYCNNVSRVIEINVS